MPWYSFPEVDRQFPAPSFCLPSIDGKFLGPASYRPRANLILVFLPEIEDTLLISNLLSLSVHQESFREMDGQILPIVAIENTSLGEMVAPLALSFPVLADPDRTVRQIYQDLLPVIDDAERTHLVFVLDRYGAPYSALSDANLKSPRFATEISDWLQFIELQCPE